MFELGIESFIKNKKWMEGLDKNCRVAFLGHQASVSQNLQSSLYLIQNYTPLTISCVIGPQHGFKGAEQANMLTTENEKSSLSQLENMSFKAFEDSQGIFSGLKKFKNISSKENEETKCPIFSLYSSKTRRLTKEMLSHFDAILIDLQDVGCRVYTYLTTMLYILEDCNQANKSVWILDRPNPAGRTVEGSLLNKKFISFVGASSMPIRHGMTLGELALWYSSIKKLNIQLKVIKMNNYHPKNNPWPIQHWLMPSPNMVDEECARCYSGTVLLEGTKVSEARGTTFPLKAFGFPGMKTKTVLTNMVKMAPEWLKSCVLREEFFKPTFDKFKDQICSAIRIYTDTSYYRSQEFQPYRIVSLFLKNLKKHHPDFDWILPPPYEYEYEKLPIDILSGDDFLRNWIEDEKALIGDLEEKLSLDENLWREKRKPFLQYLI